MLAIKDNTTPKALTQLALLQGVFSIFFAGAVFVWLGAYQAVSAALGGFAAVIATLYSALKVRTPIAQSPPQEDDEMAQANSMLQRFYRIEVTKLVLTITWFVVAIVLLRVAVLPFIAAYLLTALVINWIAFLIIDRTPQ